MKIADQLSQKKNAQQIISIHTKERDSMILPEFMGIQFFIHNGHDWISLVVDQEHVGHKLGEFAPTKKVAVYKRKKRK